MLPIIFAIVISLIIIIAASVGILYYIASPFNTKLLTAYNGDVFRIHRRHKNGQEAVDTLATLNQLNILLMSWLKYKYITNNSQQDIYRHMTELLLSRYDPDVLKETSPTNWAGETSYTVNKGEELVFCIRRGKDGQKCDGGGNCTDAKKYDIHHLHVLFFVSIHEMAHIATESFGHELDFWTTFKWLLKEAQTVGLYNSTDYSKFPVNYCGKMTIDYNPLFDDSLPTL